MEKTRPGGQPSLPAEANSQAISVVIGPEVAGTCTNEYRTCSDSDAPVARGRSAGVPHRYRLILPSGQPSPAFKPKPGELGKLLAEAFPGQDEFELVEA